MDHSLSKLPKRRLVSSSDLNFFASAESSFQPRPYSPHIQPSDSRSKSLNSRSLTRSHDALPLPPAGMDPQLSDPNVIFIHPPFTTFPGSASHPHGLTYPLMAENPEWFLDPNDFQSQNNTNPNAISYPPHLEPPRGWCPAKKKDLKERGVEGWPEGEEPRLRCTFCRRTYAGVNAKSMWRRHVFEKHKIAMSNRRDDRFLARPRGRGSGKENRQMLTGKIRDESHDKVVNMDVGPQTEIQNRSHKSRFRSLLPADEAKVRREKFRNRDSNSADSLRSPTGSPRLAEEDLPPPQALPSTSQPHPLSPPLTPHSSDPSNSGSSDKHIVASPLLKLSTIPPSPYDPLLTPSFRHSPPRLPSDQPWRFPSPSHPLHSQTRELSLSMLVRDTLSPLTKGTLTAAQSPSAGPSSPVTRIDNRSGTGASVLVDIRTPASLAKLQKPISKAFLLRSQFSSPVSESPRNRRMKHRIEASPLSRILATTTPFKGHKKTISQVTDDWFSEASFLSPSRPSLGTPELLTGNDPFVTLYRPWTPMVSASSSSRTIGSPSKVVLEDSPVLRSSSLPTTVGLGIGLLEPFSLPKVDDIPSLEADSDFSDAYVTGDGSDEAEVAGELTTANKGNQTEEQDESPPLKKRRISVDSKD